LPAIPSFPTRRSSDLITQPDVLIVSDTLKDERFVRNQLATQAGVRFYAGAPLLTPEGYALGTLSVMDYVPRALTGVQTRILWALDRKSTRLNSSHVAI